MNEESNKALNEELRRRLKSESSTSEIKWNMFSHPKPKPTIRRQRVWDSLVEAAKVYSILVVSGDSGCGRTCLITDFVISSIQSGFYSKCLWYTVFDHSSFENLILELHASGLPVAGQTPRLRMLALIDVLESRDIVLVLDDFKWIETDQKFNDLFSLLEERSDKARIILATNQKAHSAFKTKRATIELLGFDEVEVREIFSKHDIAITSKELKELRSKTNFLPQGIKIVIDIHQKKKLDVLTILENELKGDDSYFSWNEKNLSALTAQERAMLQYLACVEGRFNVEIVNLLIKNLQISFPPEINNWAKGVIVLTTYSDGESWSMPDFLRTYLRTTISAKIKTEIDAGLAIFYWSKYESEHNDVKSDIGKQLYFGFKACKHYQEARNYGASAFVLKQIAHKAKPLGLYEQFLPLAKNEIENNPNRSLWIDFHFCHCCQITGEYNTSLQYLVPLLMTKFMTKQHDTENINLHLKCTMLFAELISDLGYDKYALQVLRGCVDAYDVNKLEFSTAMQMISLVGWFYLRIEQYSEAEEILEKQVKEVKLINDLWGAAVSSTRLGILSYRKKKYVEAVTYLVDSYKCFASDYVRDRRGEAWASSYLGLCYLRIHETDKAEEFIINAITIHREVNAIDREHSVILSEYLDLVKNENLRGVINAELDRIKVKIVNNRITQKNVLLIDQVIKLTSEPTNPREFNFSPMLMFANHGKGIKMDSYYVHSYIAKAKKENYSTVITNLFNEYKVESFFYYPLCNKVISEFSKEDPEVARLWVVPYIKSILITTDSIRKHYARVLELAGMPLRALELLAVVTNKDHNYYTTLGNCHKDTDRFFSRDCYLNALHLAEDNIDVARICNNLAQLIYNTKWSAMYVEGVQYCHNAIKRREGWSYPLRNLLLIEIELSDPTETVDVLKKLCAEYKLPVNFICPDVSRIWNRDKKKLVRDALKCIS